MKLSLGLKKKIFRAQVQIQRQFKLSRKGSALLLAMFTMMFLAGIATDVALESVTEVKLSSVSVQQIQAYYAAKAGVELGLLRIYAFQKAVHQLGDVVPDKSMLDMIWNFPMAWPPPALPGMSAVDKGQLNELVKNSLIKTQYVLQIESESSRIDLNDLDSPSKVVREATKNQILEVLQSRLKSDEEWQKRYRNFDFTKLVNNMMDWVDEDHESRNGGVESSSYQNSELTKNDLPPNAPFKTIQELHMVAGMTDDFYEALAPRVTVYGSKGINVNYANEKTLESLSPAINAEAAKKIVEARSSSRGPFKNMDDFVGYLATIGISSNPFNDGKEEKVPLIFDNEQNFRITSTGVAGKMNRKIVAIVYDFDRVKSRLSGILKKELSGADGSDKDGAKPPNENPSDPSAKAENKTDTKSTPPKPPPPKGRPNVVYWVEE